MTISVQNMRVIYTGNGVTTNFPCNFSAMDDGDIEVWIYDIGAQTLTLKSGSDYNINSVPGDTFSIDYPLVGDPLENTHKIVIQRIVDLLQPASFSNATGFDPATLTLQLDDIVRQVQQVSDAADRAVKVDISGTQTPEDLLDLINELSEITGISPVVSEGGNTARSLSDHFGDRLSVFDFGAVGDGVTDDTSAFNAALASANSLKLVVPKGVYALSAPLLFDGDELSIEGDGQYHSVLKWTADCDGLKVGTISPVEHLHLQDIGLITTQAASTRTAVTFAADITALEQRNPGLIVERVEVKGDVTTADWWGVGIKATDAAIPVLRDVQIFGRSGGTSAQIASATDYAIQLESTILLVAPQFDNVWVLEYDTGLYLHTPGTLGIEGVYVESCNFVMCNYGVHARSEANGGYKPAQINIVNNHFQCRIQDIKVIEYLHVNICNNFLSSAHDENITTHGVYLQACVYGIVANNTIQALPVQTTMKGIEVYGCAQIAVCDNVVYTPGVGVEFTNITFECYERGTRQAGAGAAFANTGGVASNVSILGAIERVAAATTGLIAKTSAHAAAMRTITAPAAGITVSNGDGVADNPTLALANDLAALEALASTGLAARTAADTWAQRTLSAGIGIDVTNGNGVSGNPTTAVKAGTVRHNIAALAAGTVLAAGNTFYFTSFASATENVASGVMAVPGVARDLYAICTVAPSSGQSHTFTLMKNGVAQALTCQVAGTATTANDLVNTVTFAAGDTWSIRAVASASAVSTIPKAGFSFLPTVT